MINKHRSKSETLTGFTFRMFADSESKTKLVVPLVAIGLLLGTLFIIDLVLMCSKKGFMYGLMTKCSEGKGDAGLRLSKCSHMFSFLFSPQALEPFGNSGTFSSKFKGLQPSR